MFDHIIKNGTLVTEDGSKKANVYIKDGKIVKISADPVTEEAKEVTDASGKLVLPGFIETHVHSRDGAKGTPEKEDFSTSSSAAASVGITTLFEMPNCNPTIYNVENLESLVSIIEPKAHTDFCVWGLALGDLNADELPKLAEAGVVAFKFFWGYAVDSRDYTLVYNYREGMENIVAPPDDAQIYRLFENVAKTGKRIGIHAENFDIIKMLTAKALEKEDRSYEALLATRPVCAETSIIDTAIDIAKQLGTKLHILHVGVGDGVDHIRAAKADGVNLTAETCSHYLALNNEDALRCGAEFKTYPLIRTKYDQEKVWEGLKDGTLDWVASDHAPHTLPDKQKDFFEASAGISGVEAFAPVLLTAVNEGKITLSDLVRVSSATAAKTFGLYPQKGCIAEGSDADFAIVDMDDEYVFDQTKMFSKAKWTPYNGMHFKGKVVKTILRGQTTFENGNVSDPSGKFIRV